MSLQEAEHLEARLASMGSKPDPKELSDLRSALCEKLSEHILDHPKLALRKDCCGRLWRGCVYTNITTYRSRISKEKKKKGNKLALLQQSLDDFLRESIDLYEFMVERYEDKLGLYSPTTSQSQGSAAPNPDDRDALVPILYRLLISVGDLYRYKEDWSKAEFVYNRASRLAPGMGQPYNQLAVIFQQKEGRLYCVALYYYARSILSVHEPFSTSRGNVERLLKSNREWLATLPMVDWSTTSSSSNNMNKTAGCRRGTAEFVDLHYDFMLRQSTPARIDAVLGLLESLLVQAALGDALLCKMAAINAFAVHNDPEHTKPLAHRFGLLLLNRMERSLRNRPGPSVRQILPAMIVMEYVAQWPDPLPSYWSKVATVGNLLLSSRSTSTTSSNTDPSALLPKEYRSVIGYTPYTRFLGAPDTYLPPSDALASMETKEKTNESELRTERFLLVLKRMEGSKLLRTDEGKYYAYGTDPPDLLPPALPNDMIEDDDDDEEDKKDDDGDLVMYKASDSGVALLVPGNLLQTKANLSTTDAPAAAAPPVPSTLESLTDPEETKQPPRVVPPPRHAAPLGPPPGFGPPPTLLDSLAQQPVVTANPFMVPQNLLQEQQQPPAPALLGLQPSQQSSQAHFLLDSNPQGRHQEEDETSFLDSSLLRSLWMVDEPAKPTKNPFWT